MANRKRRAKGDGALFKRASDGLWVGSVEIASADGKRRQKRVTAKDYRAAKLKLDELRQAVASGMVPIARTTTTAHWLNHWLTTHKKPHVRQSTYDWYEEAVRLHTIPHIGQVRLDQLTPEHVRFMLSKANTSANAQRAHKTLNLAIKDAVADGLLARNVVDAVKKPGHVKAERGSLTVDQAATAIRAAIAAQDTRAAEDPAMATRWVTAFLTGARPAEVIGLEWNRVDFDRGVIDFSWQLQQLKKAHGCLVDDKPTCGRTRPGYCPDAHWDLPGDFEYRECRGSLLWTRPKTKTGVRIVPMVPLLDEMLRRHRTLTAAEPNPHGLVWHYPDGRPVRPKDDWQRWHELMVAAKLPPVEPYAVRHTTATLLESLGVPEEVRMQIMGQSSKVAHRMYVHVDQTRTRDALQKLESLLELK